MKLLLSSSDPRQIEFVRRDLSKAGIAYESRHLGGKDDGSGIPVYPELWIKHTDDYPRAARVLARAQGH
jgi:hypothetical protein